MPPSATLPAFLRLWFLCAFSFVLLKLLFNQLAFGWIDLRPVALLELAALPLGQTLVIWAVTRRRGAGTRSAQSAGSPS